MEATSEKTKTGALFAAAEHYLADLQNKRRLVTDGAIDPELARELSTTELPISVTLETTVGHDDSVNS